MTKPAVTPSQPTSGQGPPPLSALKAPTGFRPVLRPIMTSASSKGTPTKRTAPR